MDSSEGKFGKEDIDMSKSGCIDGLEDRILWEDCGGGVGTEDCRVVVVEECRTGGSHMKLCLDTVVDVRRMHDSSKQHSLPLLNIQIAKHTAQIDHSVKADVCKMVNHDAYNHYKIARFEINVDDNNDNNKQQHNDAGKRACNGLSGVGMCK